MVAKTMVEQKTCGEPVETICQGCSQQHECQEAYKKLANIKGTSVVFKVCIAFLLPLLVFIASLAAFERILAEAIDAKELRTAISFPLALSVTFVCVLIIRTICHSCETRPRLRSGNRNPEK